jgi:hypothetical protein
MRCTVHVTHEREMINSYEVFVGKQEGKRPLGTPRHDKCTQNFLLKNIKGIYHFKDLGIDGKVTETKSSGNRVGRCGLDASGS